MLKLPFLGELEQAENILIAGAGGGYDVYCGLPLYFGLKAQGKNVYLGNLSFAFLPPLGPERLSPTVYEVTAESHLFGDYFPEYFLAEWLREVEQDMTPIYCFERTGVKPLLEGYRVLVDHLQLDTVVLVDGGTDSLMRGDEDGLGTPNEDMTSIVAVNELDIPRKMMASLGFGVDRFHGVSNERSLAAVAELTQSGGYLGAWSLMSEMPEVQKYQAAAAYAFAKMPNDISIVSSSILSAINGHYGNHHATRRTGGSELWINPLMAIYLTFNVSHLAERLLYRKLLLNTVDYDDVRTVIRLFREELRTVRNRGRIPN